MKTQTRAKQQPKTQFVIVSEEQQINNREVEKAYTKIVAKATELIRKFEMAKYRTWIDIDHLKEEQNVHLVREFVSFHWNVTLSMNKDGRYYIFFDIDQEGISKFGSGLTNYLLREAYAVTQSNDNTDGIQYSLRVNFASIDVHNFYYRRLADGETTTLSITTEERVV